MINGQVKINELTPQIILKKLNKLGKRYHFIEVYGNDEFLDVYDIENSTLWDEFAYEWFIGKEYSSTELSENSFKVTLKNNIILEFKPANIFYMNKRKALYLIMKKIHEWKKVTQRIYLQVEKVEYEIKDNFLNHIHTTILNESFEGKGNKAKETIEIFVEDAYRTGRGGVSFNIPVSIDTNLIFLQGRKMDGKRIYKISYESM